MDVSFDAPSVGVTHGYLSLPPGEARAPAVVVAHEWWGLNDDIRSICDRFAAEGFATLAVDLYKGRSTNDAAEAMQLVNDMKTEEAMKAIEGAVAYLGAHPRCEGKKVGVTGFCLGGAMSIAAACTVAGISAAVPFYGIPRPDFVDFTGGRPPILAHFGKNDGSITPDRIERVAAAAAAAGSRFELCLYEAGHAFMRAHDPKAYEPTSAALAWKHTVDFFRAELG